MNEDLTKALAEYQRANYEVESTKRQLDKAEAETQALREIYRADLDWRYRAYTQLVEVTLVSEIPGGVSRDGTKRPKA